MYYFIGLLIMAIVSYALGFSTGRELLRRQLRNSLEELTGILKRLSEALKEVVDEDDEPLDPDESLFDVELGIDEPLNHNGDGVWEEVEINNDCGYGCKVYEHTRTGRRALAHNSAYGCKRSFHPIKE